jgi:hypothetical protein
MAATKALRSREPFLILPKALLYQCSYRIDYRRKKDRTAIDPARGSNPARNWKEHRETFRRAEVFALADRCTKPSR